jgi:hypothetical protein
MASIRRELAAAMEGETYRTYRCTGKNCDKTVVLPIWATPLCCGTEGCRGELTARKVLPISRLLDRLGFPSDDPNGSKKSSLKAPDEVIWGSLSGSVCKEASSGHPGLREAESDDSA